MVAIDRAPGKGGLDYWAGIFHSNPIGLSRVTRPRDRDSHAPLWLARNGIRARLYRGKAPLPRAEEPTSVSALTMALGAYTPSIPRPMMLLPATNGVPVNLITVSLPA